MNIYRFGVNRTAISRKLPQVPTIISAKYKDNEKFDLQKVAITRTYFGAQSVTFQWE